MTETAPEMGHNNPPVPLTPSPDELEAYLKEASQRVLNRKEELLADQPAQDEITNDEEAERVTDFIKNVNACNKNLEELRKTEKGPYFELGKVVDGFFKEHASPLLVAKGNAAKPLNAYLTLKAKEERERREEEARKLREEAQKKADEAKEQEQADMKPEAEITINKAIRDEKKAERLEVSASSGVGLAHSRGQTGGVASIRKTWIGEITDIDNLDLEQLRKFINRTHLESALNRFVKEGGRNLRGASIFEKSDTVVR